MDNEVKGITMKNRNHIRTSLRRLIFLLFLFALTTGTAVADPLAENREVLFSGEGAELAQKAAELGSPAAVYEYVRNSHEYALYHGSRSNSINTFGGMRGSDVDIASVLIAMYRSQNIPARYAVGTVSIPATNVANWLGVKDIDLAAAIMDDQGIQNVAISPDRQSIEFEHVWVQAQVPYDDYRGAFASTTNCTATPERCNWIDLDPSYKLREYHNQNIDVYGVVNFDYNRYYNAIKNDDAEYRDKGPLEIYEEQILDWLKTNHPGKTLDDVADPGTLVAVEDGILPASLPYQVTSGVQTYDSIADHDAANDPDWAKYLNGSFHIEAVMTGGGTISITTGIGGPHALADLSTKRLTVTYSPITVNGVADRVEVRLDGELIATPFQSSGSLTFPLWTPFSMDITLDGAPATESGQPDNKIEVTYSDMVVGGYYLIGTGGGTSNWSQVHRAADQLLQANETYPIINNASDVPYVDQNGNGVVDGPDTPLLDTPDAQDALTGGLLYVAMSQYFTKFVAGVRHLDSLNHIISPIEGFVGVVSSTYEVDYLGDTAFSVMPGGLLIDMKGQSFTGAWRVDAPSTFANSHFELLGHHVSSLEHEIWQELTGFDAVSTVRGIQMALAAGHSLLTPENTGSGNNMVAQYSGFQFNNSIPSGFTYTPFTVFSTQPATWTHTTEGAQMEILKREVNATTSSLRRAKATYDFHTTSGLYGWVECVDYWEQALRDFYNANGNVSINPITLCLNTYSGPILTVLSDFEYDYLNTIIPDMIGQTYFNFFDRAQGFNPSDHVYRALPLTTNQHTGSRVQDIRDDVMIGDEITFSGQNGRWAYVIPGHKTEGEVYRFSVYLEKVIDPTTGYLASQSYSIANDYFSAGGGWVNGTQTLEAATAIPGTSVIQPTFNNEVFTDQNLVAQTNNDLIRTPSTADPVSTVTGNMYHDETEFTIKGRGLDYAFTRSYNSSPVRADMDGPFGFGWAHSYNMSLRSNDYGDCPNCTSAQAAENGNGISSSITFLDERGGEHTYLLNADGSGTRSVAKNPPGEFDILQLNTPASGQFTLSFRNGVKYVFSGPSSMVNTPSQTARLAYIEDPYGNRLNMSYDASNRLIGVSDNLGIAGRTGLTIAYHDATNHIQSISDWTGRQWLYDYDADGNLTAVTDPLLSTRSYTYHPDSHLLNELIQPEDRNGRRVKTAFTYYRNNKAFNYANALGETETLDYDLYRQRTRVTDPRGFVREHFYDKTNGALLKLKEPDNGILRFENNEDGLRYAKYDAQGYETKYSYNSVRTTDGASSDTGGTVTLEQDAYGNTLEYDYGLFDQIVRVRDKKGNERFYAYYDLTDAAVGAVRGRLHKAEAMLAGQRVTLEEHTYYPDGNLKQTVEYIDSADASRQRITEYVYDAQGFNLTSKTVRGASSGGAVTMDYTYYGDGLGRLKTETVYRRKSAADATQLALTTSYEYDDLGRVVRVTDPRGNIAETVYDQNGKTKEKRIHYKQPDNSFDVRTIVTREYDAADRLVKEIDHYNNETLYEYDAAGNLVKKTDANGHATRYEYDAMNRRTAVIDANGHRAEFVYDLGGRLVKTIDANGNAVRHEYDALGRKTKDISPLGFETLYEYDANGNLVKMTDANAVAGLQPMNPYGATVYNEYDAFNRLLKTVDARNGETAFTYDLLGNKTSITDAEGRVTTFVYNDLGRLVEVIDPLIETPDLTVTFTHDELGNVLTKTDRKGQQTVHTYDELNRLVETVYADAGREFHTYDQYGDLTEIGNDAVTYTYTYDAMHRMTSKTDGRLGKSLAWEHDAVGKVIRKTDYQGEVTEYQYDSTNRLVSLANQGYVQVSYHYDPAGRFLNRILSNRASTEYLYDEDNRLMDLTNLSGNGTVVDSTVYTRDRVGNILTRTAGADVMTFTYDPLYRLETADYPGTFDDRVYSYDKTGNRLLEIKDDYTDMNSYSYDGGNRLTRYNYYELDCVYDCGDGAVVFSYDDNGNMTEKRIAGSQTWPVFEYDAKNRLRTADVPVVGGMVQARFEYDPHDYRIAKYQEGSARRALYHLEGEHIEAVYDADFDGNIYTNPAPVATFLRGVVVDEVVNGYYYDAQGEKTNYTFHHDQLQSVTGMSGHDGQVLETNTYRDFGWPKSVWHEDLWVSQSPNFLKYTGREFDKDLMLFYYRARYYDPSLGRFLSEDPRGFEAGVNFYTYVQNNPINFADPMGLIKWSAVGKGSAAIIGGGATAVFGAFSSTTGAGAVLGVPAVIGGSATFGWGVNEFIAGWLDADIGNVPVPSIPATASLACGSSVERAQQVDLIFSSITAGANIGSWAGKLGPVSNMELGGAAADLINLGISAGSANTPAAGGFVLYPNKPNTNMMNSVYNK